MKNLIELTKDEKSLLLYFETCYVDRSGRIDIRRINADDIKIATEWNASGFVKYGRISSEFISDAGSLWCELSDNAWELAGQERKARGQRCFARRTWTTTEEKRAA